MAILDYPSRDHGLVASGLAHAERGHPAPHGNKLVHDEFGHVERARGNVVLLHQIGTVLQCIDI